MTLEEFREKYDGAPYELYEFAYLASEVIDCKELALTGEAYLAAREQMQKMLQKYDVEQG